LWRCLTKYLKPVTWQREDTNQRDKADTKLRQKLINNFVKNCREKINEIKNAINAGDIILAHRLVHNLKSNAGQLNKMLLQQAAREVEHQLKDGENLVTPVQMEVLERSLNAAIRELEPLVREQPKRETTAEPLDNPAARELLEKLGTLLKHGDPDCLLLIESLSAVSGSEDLIQQIEDLDFKPALATLAELKKKTQSLN
jgi:two-component system sensor histidine kinase/response regulator